MTRPTRWAGNLKSFEPGGLAAFKLFPGSTNTGEIVTVAIVNMGYCAPRWIAVQSSLAIDGVGWPAMMPGQVYVSEDARWQYGPWSAVINFPIVSHLSQFAGVHTLLLRTIVETT